jgi:hypothetical protein
VGYQSPHGTSEKKKRTNSTRPELQTTNDQTTLCHANANAQMECTGKGTSGCCCVDEQRLEVKKLSVVQKLQMSVKRQGGR